MRLILLVMLGGTALAVMQRISLLRRCGWPGAAQRLYRICAWCIGLGVWAAMLMQEWVLWRSGMLSWRTGLPLHLCSLNGVLMLPMLLTGNSVLWHFTLYTGIPGALLALVFPAVMDTAQPLLTALGFYSLHVLLCLAPLLPMSLGRRPEPFGAAQAWALLMLAGIAAMAVNALLNSNYLFIAYPVANTPLEMFARWGRGFYPLVLGALCTLLLALEGWAVWQMERRQGCKECAKCSMPYRITVYNRRKI